MNNDELKAEIALRRTRLQVFNLRIGKLLGDCDRALASALPSDLAEELMTSCIKLEEDELLGSKAKPLVNAIHKAVFKNAKHARAEERKQEEKNLDALMPKCYAPKRGKKTEEKPIPPYSDEDTETEIDNPSGHEAAGSWSWLRDSNL